MKKLLFFVIIIGSLTAFSEKVFAQSADRVSMVTNQKTEDAVLVAYPNPSRDFIIVKSKDSSLRIKSVTFYSILGMQVATYNLNTNSSEINIEKLRPGKYLMRYILSDDTQKVTQIIKQ